VVEPKEKGKAKSGDSNSQGVEVDESGKQVPFILWIMETKGRER
jgi:hypothetical protein